LLRHVLSFAHWDNILILNHNDVVYLCILTASSPPKNFILLLHFHTSLRPIFTHFCKLFSCLDHSPCTSCCLVDLT
jgi:hypothetical protein